MKVPWNIDSVALRVTKHFALNYMRRWGWDFHDLREGMREAYAVEKVGASKYEIFMSKSGHRKVIIIYYDAEDALICITGAEGGKRK